MAKGRTTDRDADTTSVRERTAERLTPPGPRDARELARRARGLEGRFRSGNPTLAEEHDRFLDDAFGE